MPAGCHVEGGSAGWAVIVHGGFLSAERRRNEAVVTKIKKTLAASARAAGEILNRDGSGVDAVEAAIVMLEDSPEFDAGRGSALTAEGNVELDAAIMRGDDLGAGAVAGVATARNPIRAARAVLERSGHVLLQGEGADRFAREQGIEQAGPAWFVTPAMRERLRNLQNAAPPSQRSREGAGRTFGTVGCVVRDRNGRIVAGTSTGGTLNKLPGRVGDSPLIGAGTYADSRWCGVSATGQGEFFIRSVAAYRVCALMELKGLALREAMNEVIHQRVTILGGKGGMIAVDCHGNLCAQSNTDGLLYAAHTQNGVCVTAFDDD
ncbi:MAG: isoaspartyl peptidase/L-asparaginase [Gammaproteobacteria bacterium]|nr:isoaspartyl peptidase/L-asparaginase [Gammaproteobacteria bacterium]